MITLKKLNKYYNRHKKNEIHVINNTSLELGDTGLVALLGPSGCGKTTLLNAIGGLDKVSSGQIYINGKKMPKKGSNKKDKIRVLNIGYIFQNYNLLDNMTVYDNVAISLKMIGIKNKAAIKSRVDYILEAVGMYRFRGKLAGNLSGGQRQRVGIARALVKNPEVIIADEPTGNLDSKNTIEIMNIIKAISQVKLVILVTHEKDLAHFYASRIIEIEDGKITNDYENEHENELDYRIDNKIYLKDFKNIDNIKETNANINIYSDKKESVRLDIVVKNGNIYIKSNNKNTIEVVDDESAIEFVNDHYKKISREDYENSSFNLNALDNSKNRLRYTSIYNGLSMLTSGIKKVRSYTLMKKILLLGFFASAVFIVYAVSSIFGVTNIEEKNFMTSFREYIRIQNNKNNLDDYLKIENMDSVGYMIPGSSSIMMTIVKDDLYQFSRSYMQISGSLAASEVLTEDNLSYGRLPSSFNEIVIDEMLLDSSMMMNYEFKMMGIENAGGFVGVKFKIGSTIYEVVGIASTVNPSIFAPKDELINIVASNQFNGYDYSSPWTKPGTIANYELFKDELVIKEGHAPTNDYEVIINVENKDLIALNKTVDVKVNDQKLKVVGYYSSRMRDTKYYVNESTYKYNTILNNSGMVIYSGDKKSTIESLQEAGFNAEDIYQMDKDEYIRDVKEAIISSLIISGILLAISFVEIFLMIRASFLSRIKEVGIYRAIGVKRSDIYKMFLGEILVITTLTGLFGVMFMSSFLSELIKVPYFSSMYVMDERVIITSVVILYGLNIIVGLLPIRQIIRKTPAEILSRNDVD